MLRSGVSVFGICIIFNFIASIACGSSYSVIAPGTIRSNRKYTVCATLHNVSQPAKLIIGLRHNSTWSDKKSVSLQPMESKVVDFFPPKLDLTKEYELFVEAVEGLYFYNSTKLLVGQIEGVNIYIETDRGAYKPGDLVQFRIVILDEHARPVEIKEPIKVQITDAMGNRVKQFKDISLYQGVHTNQFQLSKDPALGKWSIKVFVAGRYAQERSVEIEVAKYVLPKFFVNIETENNFVIEHRFLKIKVFGQYTNNKFVEGKASVKIKQKEFGFTTELANFAADTVNFEALFKIDLNELEEVIMYERFLVVATLTEKQTGIMESTTTVIYLHHNSHNITMLYDEIEVKNGNPFRLKYKIQHWNNTGVKDTETSVFLTSDKKNFETKLNRDGVAIFEGEFHENRRTTVLYKNDTKIDFIPELGGLPTSNSNCNLRMQNKSIQPNSTIDILLEFVRDIPYLVYILTSHGNIVRHEFVQIEKKQKSYTIQLVPSNEMIPISFLYVHYVYAGYLTFCEYKIELPERLDNELSVVAPKDVQPGENITMTFNTKPNSRIAITAIDLSSMLLNVGNRIKKSDILNKMREDRTYVNVQKYTIIPGLLSGVATLTDIPYPPMKYIGITSIPGTVSGLDNYIRSYFPETWIFLDLNVTNAMTTVNFTLPDTITTWVVTAFSMNDKSGIGLLDDDVRITASKPFFISTSLPYSIKRGEIVSILVVIFNYYTEDLNTEVLMENPLNEFQFVDSATNMTTKSTIEKINITIPANNGKSVNFLIKAQRLGHIDVIVQATNKLARDKVLQKLLVDAEGLENSYNHELYVSLKEGENYTTQYKPNIPEKIEADTAVLQLSISGDVLLPTLDNIDNLVDIPTGCGEQNMINFAPNILVLEYLSSTYQSSKYPELVAKTERYTELGYQQELKFRHTNGGYSAFGPNNNRDPSNWLTAYVARFFIKAVKYVPIEAHIIDSSLNFLADSQLSSGAFSNTGYSFQTSFLSTKSFTAYVLLSFLENQKYAKKYESVIQKAFTFLSNDIHAIDDLYTLAIMSTVFQVAKHENASLILEKVKPFAKTKGDLQWWHDTRDDGSTDVEITSYILLALLETPGHYLPIAKWLMEQRNSHGGFKSTKDTVVGLQALIKFAQHSPLESDITIKVLYKALGAGNEKLENGILSLDPQNLKILQHTQLPSSTRLLDIEISGKGNIFLQFSYNYRTPSTEFRTLSVVEEKSLIVKKKADLTANGLRMTLEICIQYKPPAESLHLTTNMIIAEVGLPSGFVANDEHIKLLKSGDVVDRIENDLIDKVVFYFTYIEANEEKCVDLVADNKYDVRNHKPAMIVAYEYYHRDRQEVVTYEIGNNKNEEN